MILKGIATLFYNLLNTIWIVELPEFPESISTAFDQAIQYIVWGFSFLRGLVGETAYNAIWIFFGLTVAAEALYIGYDMVMWVVKKIPMANIQK